MNITAIKTDKISPNTVTLLYVLDKHLTAFRERSILAITSKIVSMCEGRFVKVGSAQKEELIKREAEYLLPSTHPTYHIDLTVKNNILIPNAGIDESNGNGYYILWPKDPQKTANRVREYLCRRFSLKHVGVIITDSKTTPLRWGTTGIALAHSGFAALNDYIGKPDIFGRNLQYTKANIMDGLAASAVVAMGEGSEQTPLAVIADVPFVRFQGRNPTDEELRGLAIGMKEDLYAPLLTSVKWEKKK